MDILKLLPEQVTALNKEADELNKQYFILLEEVKLEDRILPGCDLQGITDIGDNLTVSRLTHIKKRIKTIDSYLNNYELVEKYDDEKISIGTEFTVYTDFGNNDGEKGTYKLIQTSVSAAETKNYVSLDCKLGAAVLNKRIGEPISYLTPANKVVNGVILDILPEKQLEIAKEKVVK